jgi:plasmid maintenance system killer protein
MPRDSANNAQRQFEQGKGNKEKEKQKAKATPLSMPTQNRGHGTRRICFRWSDGDAREVQITDYH